ncbi:DUF2061 domain-containing protein [Marinomonas sp. C2222]|uniref:DUF2061 domain-containing protein n=1 Tax=Marinomonas sargassi TaxID=2984494 RepID=A0ABT2YVD2_9GAMM|nr:DUF2061 domain-containing protein [Marinomonas sargassi]MCV2403857.1 DUF2061 domain-containing protein [Marinomonas sargassi]
MIKTMTFSVMHFSIAFLVAYLITGSFVVGGLVAIVEPAINTVAFYFHELVWSKIQNKREEGEVKGAMETIGESYALRSC